MEILSIIERVGVSLFFCMILIQSQKEKDSQMLRTNQKLLETNIELSNTNKKLGDVVQEVVKDVKTDVEVTKNTVINIAEMLKKEGK